MNAFNMPIGARSVIADVFRFVNPYALDIPPPDPEPSLRARSVYGAFGAIAAIVGIALPVVDSLEKFRYNEWLILIYVILAVLFVGIGISMGKGLNGRRPHKVVCGALFGTLAVVFIVRVLLTMIDTVW